MSSSNTGVHVVAGNRLIIDRHLVMDDSATFTNSTAFTLETGVGDSNVVTLDTPNLTVPNLELGVEGTTVRFRQGSTYSVTTNRIDRHRAIELHDAESFYDDPAAF